MKAGVQAGAHRHAEDIRIMPREARADLFPDSGRPMVRYAGRRIKKIRKGRKKMSKIAIKVEDLPSLDATCVQVLRCVVLKLCGKRRGRVEYREIGKSINKDRDVVAKAVKRLIQKEILSIENDELVLLNVVEVAS